jgi:hypothetical protein
MTRRLITREFVVSTVIAITMAIGLSFGGVYLTNKCLVPVGQAQAGVVGP